MEKLILGPTWIQNHYGIPRTLAFWQISHNAQQKPKRETKKIISFSRQYPDKQELTTDKQAENPNQGTTEKKTTLPSNYCTVLQATVYKQGASPTLTGTDNVT